MNSSPDAAPPSLDRAVTLPALIFYGLGVTVGAGIFALIGETLGLAITGAVVALAFAGYVASLVSIPERATALAVVVISGAVAWWGVRESVLLAGVITVLEVGTLVVVVAFGADLLTAPGLYGYAFVPTIESAVLAPILAGSVIAFFAFVGFENIANLAEETVNPKRTAPLAIAAVFVISLTIYVLLALVAVAAPDRAGITESSAPMAALFEQVSGRSSRPVATIAAIAMLNGILIQVVMASRVLYGMAKEQLLPDLFVQVDTRRKTPARSTLLVTVAMVVLILFFPLVQLARLTSLVTLGVFALVNLALFVLGRRHEVGGTGLAPWVGLTGSVLCAALASWQLVDGLT